MESCNLSLLSADYHNKFYNLENKSVLYFQSDFQILVNHLSYLFFYHTNIFISKSDHTFFLKRMNRCNRCEVVVAMFGWYAES